MRRTLAGSGVVMLGAAAGAGALSMTRRAHGAPWILPDDDVEVPNSHEIATLRMLADTILPNSDGSPGGIESNAFDTISDPYYGINPYISEIVSDIDDAAFWAHRYFTNFKNLSLSRRTKVLEERLGQVWWSPGSLYKEAYEGVIALTKLNYYGALQNSAGTNYIGFPGPSAGYAPGGGSLPAELSCASDCGGYGGACYCDSACQSMGDCCPDYGEQCL